MSHHPIISVIVPVYNNAPYLKQCLTSITEQTLHDIEIICINDGSTDDSENILLEYAEHDKRVKVLSTENGGAAKARNKGLEIAHGEFVCFMDSDDYYPSSDILETLYNNANKYGVKISGGSIGYFTPDSPDLKLVHWDLKQSFAREAVVKYRDYQYDYGYTRYIFNRDFLASNNLTFPEYSYFEDPPFLVKAMILAEQFCTTSMISYAYRCDYKTTTWNRKKVSDYIKGLKDIWELSIQHKLPRLIDHICCHVAPHIKELTKHTDKEQKAVLDNIRHAVDTATPLISVIVPVYKTEATLRRCLDSICCQTYKNLEIICVNDGSPDGCGAILDEYASRDCRIKVINQKNQGLSAARNTGLDAATGAWITGLDSDDYLEADAYESCLSMLRTPYLSLVCFGTEIVGGTDYSNQPYFNYPKEGIANVTPELLSKTNACFWNKLFRKDLIDRFHARFPVGLWFEDEAFFNIIAPYIDSIGYVSARKHKYVQDPGSESIMSKAAAGNTKILDQMEVMDFILTHYSQHPLPPGMEAYEKHVLRHYYEALICLSANSPSLNDTIWNKYRFIVDKHNKRKICEEDIVLSAFYYQPAYLSRNFFQQLNAIDKQKEREVLLLSYPTIYKRYNILKFRLLFAWGNRRKRYKAKLYLLKNKIRQYRAIKAELKKKARH